MKLQEALTKHGGRESLSEYERGWVDGVFAYAWHKNGQLFVGTTGTLLGDTIDQFLTAERRHREHTSYGILDDPEATEHDRRL